MDIFEHGLEIKDLQPTLINEAAPRELTDEDVLVRISVSARHISYDRNSDPYEWPSDISNEWKQVRSDRGKKYRKFVEINEEKDDEDLLTVRHRADKIISPSNFLESDVRLSRKGIALAAAAAALSAAIAAGGATAVIISHQHRKKS
jgi:hypothetical protein